MQLREFKIQLGAHPAARIIFSLPDGGIVPRHFHVTEVGRVQKQFVDCGGKFRASESCVLQTWTGTNIDDGHRLTAGKLNHILGLAQPILPSDDLPVEIEYEDGVVSQFPIEAIAGGPTELTIHLGLKHTDSLAREKCGAKGCEPRDTDTGEEAACCGAGAGAKGCC